MAILEAAVRGEPPGRDLQDRVAAMRAAVCPYRGLRPFREEDTSFFFGREMFTDRLAEAVERHNFVAVVGDSGSGKSSVVQAGLMPRLRQIKAGRVWDMVRLVPGDRPLRALAAALHPLLEPNLDDEVDRLAKVQKLGGLLAEGKIPLRDVVDRVLKKQPGTDRLLFVVDQWEELYTLCKDAATQRRFVDTLLEATATEPLTVVLTLRADFYGRVLGYRPLADRLEGARIDLAAMNRDEQMRAVEKPAQLVGLEFEEGLVKRILDDVDKEPGNLPQLEFALTQLWEKRTDIRLLHQTYQALGEVQGAIASYAEEEVYQKLKPAEQAIFPRMMIQLVHPGEGIEDTRRRATIAELGEASEALANLVRTLADKRLIVTGRDETTGNETIEVSHEALIRRWGRLREWINADRDFRRWQDRLRANLGAWQATQHDKGALLRGALLAEAQDWLAKRKVDLSSQERDFILASDLAERQREQEELAAERRLREAAEAAKEAEQRRAEEAEAREQEAKTSAERQMSLERHLREAAEAAKEAEQRRAEEAEAREQEAKTSAERQMSLERHLREAAEAAKEAERKRAHEAEAREQEANTSAERQKRLRRRWVAAAIAACLFALSAAGLAWLADQRRIKADKATDEAKKNEMQAKHNSALAHIEAANGDIERGNIPSGVFSYWQAYHIAPRNDPLKFATRNLIAAWSYQLEKPFIHDGAVKAVAFSSDRQTILTGSSDNTARLWDAKTSKPLGKPLQHAGRVVAVAFSRDDQMVLTGSWDKTAQLWDAKTCERHGDPLQHEKEVCAALFSPDGETILTASSNTVQLWNFNTGKPEGKRIQHNSHEFVKAVAFSPDGQIIVTGTHDLTEPTLTPYKMHFWNLTSGKPMGEAIQESDPIEALAFSPNGKMILTGRGEFRNAAQFWNVETRKSEGEPLQHEGAVNAVAFSRDGKTVVTGSSDQTAQLWDVTTRKARGNAFRHTSSVEAIAISQDGLTVLTGSADRMARSWTVEPRAPLGKLHEAIPVAAVAFSPDGQTALVGGSGVELWDVKTRQTQGFIAESRVVDAAAYSPDSKMILTVSSDKTLQFWDVKTRKLADEPLNHDTPVSSAAFSPDGKTIVTLGADQIIRLWDATTHKALSLLRGHQDAVYAVAYSPDSKMILTGSRDKTARLWEVETCETKYELKHEGTVLAVAFSPDGKTIVTGSADQTAQLWETETGKPIGEPIRHKADVRSVAFSPNGQSLLTGSWDKTARLWDVKTHLPLGGAMHHEGSVKAVAFHPEGKVVLTGGMRLLKGKSGADGLARLWHVVPPAADEPDKLRLSVEVRTGYFLDELGNPSRMTQSQWLERLKNLDQSYDVRSWDDLSEAEKKELRTSRD